MLRLADCRVVYPTGHEALKATSLTFHAGEIAVLLGPSGAGKSTLLRTLNGLVPLTAGAIHAEGIGKLDDGIAWHKHRQRTGMVFQGHQLIGRLTALRNVLMGRLGHHSSWRTLWRLPEADQRIALEALERMGVLDEALRRVDRLSGGQQQRVGIARALAQRPRILLADEPVASLDPTTGAKVLELIRSICKDDGIGAIVSLHQVELATQFADRVIGISQGRVMFDGPPAALDEESLSRIYQDRSSHETPPLPRIHPHDPRVVSLRAGAKQQPGHAAGRSSSR